MKARDWLVQQGLAKPGRGKFSKAAHMALEKARKEGITFEDYPKVNPAPKATGQPTKTVKSVPEKREKEKATGNSDSGNTPYLFPDEYRFPEEEYEAYRFDNGKKVPVSLREGCNTCMVSLVNHACDNPTIHDSLRVTIKRKG